ncbi:hypothetical protein, partial [Pectobacterium versatile]|uniref:hypothetical protein n=1 Tax=Pectobacterium versatile TaxID=2488639 RepID=UPI001B395B00
RWLHSVTRITYLCKLIGIRSLAACLKLELFRVYTRMVWATCLCIGNLSTFSKGILLAMKHEILTFLIAHVTKCINQERERKKEGNASDIAVRRRY